MTLHRALALASVLVLTGLSAALAQFPPPPNPNAPPPGPGSGFPAPGQAQPAGKHPCDAFLTLRTAAEKDAATIRTASERKAAREEVCPLFKRFALSEAKMVKFLETNQALCSVPPDAIKQVRANHKQTITIRNQICSAGPSPATPRLSDAFSGPALPDTSTTSKPGRGTFDTLTGNPLSR